MSVPFLSCHSYFYGLHHLSCTDDYTGRRFWRNVLHYVDCRCRCHDGCVLQVLSRFVPVLSSEPPVLSVSCFTGVPFLTICLFQMIAARRSILACAQENGRSELFAVRTNKVDYPGGWGDLVAGIICGCVCYTLMSSVLQIIFGSRSEKRPGVETSSAKTFPSIKSLILYPV